MQIKHIPLFYSFLAMCCMLCSFDLAAIPKVNHDFGHEAIDSMNINNLNDSIITEARKYLGIKYKYGGTSEHGFDCSGYTSYVFSQFSIKLPHSSYAQSQMGMLTDNQQCKKGDLIFFKGRSLRSNKVGHVGIIIANQDSVIQFIHASVTNGITVSSLNDSYYKKRLVCIRRILNNDEMKMDSIMSDFSKIESKEQATSENKTFYVDAMIEPTSQIHTVVKGDTLYHIAKIYGKELADIKKWNALHSNLIKPGQKLLIQN